MANIAYMINGAPAHDVHHLFKRVAVRIQLHSGMGYCGSAFENQTLRQRLDGARQPFEFILVEAKLLRTSPMAVTWSRSD